MSAWQWISAGYNLQYQPWNSQSTVPANFILMRALPGSDCSLLTSRVNFTPPAPLRPDREFHCWDCGDPRNYKQWVLTFLSKSQVCPATLARRAFCTSNILFATQSNILQHKKTDDIFNFRLQGFVLMWKKNGNIISVGDQILGNVSLTEKWWSEISNFTPFNIFFFPFFNSNNLYFIFF